MFNLDGLLSGCASSEDAFMNVLESLAKFSAAPTVARRCVYAVVLTTREADLEEFRPVFRHSDKDGDGRVSRKDLVRALSWTSALSMVDPNLVFTAADVDNSGFLDFRKFVTACLYGRMAPLDDWLAEQAFLSMDVDRDGFLSRTDVMKTFGYLPAGLPTHRSFGVDEWTNCCILSAGSQGEQARTTPLEPLMYPEIDEQPEPDSCAIGMFTENGILAGCITKHSHRRQGSACEVEDIMDVIQADNRPAAYLQPSPNVEVYMAQASNCRYQQASQMGMRTGNHHLYARCESHYGHGATLSSPTYVPMTR